MPEKKDSVGAMLARYLPLAFMLPAATFTGYAIGYGLDHLFGTRFLRIVFLIVGIISGFVELLRSLSRDRS
jgi:F0F1-type ATP synthase assembly protein I